MKTLLNNDKIKISIKIIILIIKNFYLINRIKFLNILKKIHSLLH
jgi:hypothetical protein